MKGDLLYKILSLVNERVVDGIDFADAVIFAGYGASANKIDYLFNKNKNKRLFNKAKVDQKRRLQKYLSKLKQEGLVTSGDSSKIQITPLGKNKLEKIKNSNLFDKNFFRKEKADEVIIVSYDIPIIFNKERNRIRGVLKILGFEMIHKSVWVGKVKLPKKFVDLLVKLKIVEYFEILKVTKNGTLKEF